MAKDWTKLYKKYKGLWVALAADEETVISIGKTAKEAYETAVDKSGKIPFLTRVPETLDAFVGTI